MSILLRIWTWLKQYWYIPVVVIVTLIVWVIFRRSGPPLQQTLAEIRAIQAQAEVKKLQAELGTEKAKEHVTAVYRAELEALDDKQRTEAKELESDPAKLASFLVRAGSRGANR